MSHRFSPLAVSVRQRLLNLANSRREDFQHLLTRFGLQRLLYRLSQSPHSDLFVLKGAMLFELWVQYEHRATRDLDLLGHGEPSTERHRTIFRDICQMQVADDGLNFPTTGIDVRPMRELDEYRGLRIRIEARLANVRIPLQVDVGFGDVVTPSASVETFPALLDFPPATVRAYTRETAIAEKFQAMVTLGMANSRMKDFFDIWTLSRSCDFDGAVLCAALRATFERRRTALPTSAPTALTREFDEDRDKQKQWKAFLSKSGLPLADRKLSQVTPLLRAFLLPPSAAAQLGVRFAKRWNPDGQWSDSNG